MTWRWWDRIYLFSDNNLLNKFYLHMLLYQDEENISSNMFTLRKINSIYLIYLQIWVSFLTAIGWYKAIMTWSTTQPTIDPLWQKQQDCEEALNKTSAVANGNGMCCSYVSIELLSNLVNLWRKVVLYDGMSELYLRNGTVGLCLAWDTSRPTRDVRIFIKSSFWLKKVLLATPYLWT